MSGLGEKNSWLTSGADLLPWPGTGSMITSEKVLAVMSSLEEEEEASLDLLWPGEEQVEAGCWSYVFRTPRVTPPSARSSTESTFSMDFLGVLCSSPVWEAVVSTA